MDYTDTYGALNPHLSTERQGSCTVGAEAIEIVTRNPPSFLRYAEETKAALQRIFKFSDTLFTRHEVTFPKHIVETFKRDVDTDEEIQIHCYTKWGYGYYHFMTEVLPNILFLTKDNAKATVFCPSSSFAHPVLTFFGVKNPIVFAAPPRSNHICRQPYIECGNPSPEKIRLLVDALRKPTSLQEHQPTKWQEHQPTKWQGQGQEPTSWQKPQGVIIFRKEPLRTVRNHAALVAMLEDVYPSVQWTTFTSATPEETAALFGRASIIVAPHGAGLTNMIFSRPGTPIYEFVPLDNPNVCYWHLAEMLGHVYKGIPCPTVSNAFVLDIEAIRPLFSSIAEAGATI